MADQPAIPAATIVLMRDGAGAPELLMVERSAALAFAPGAWVFPGGRVEPDDGAEPEGAARAAAVRETWEEVGIIVDPGELVPFARWRPSEGVSRVFDTRFFLSRAPIDARPRVDATENVRARWLTAAAGLALSPLLFPTRRVLERVARFGSFDAAVADAQTRPETVVTPWIEQRGGVPHLCIPAGLGYPVTAEPLERVTRG